jgi:glycosyltransferase involved in cell wall biosynthesis
MQPPKLIIQVPCYNEENTLGVTLEALPRQISGVGKVEWLVVDDGSQDRTSAVARERGVDHIVRLPRNRGLANAFMTGLEACLRAGADIIVNTDGDNQYCAGDIPKLIAPILRGEAEIVIGCRPIDQIAHFSRLKRWLQSFGSRVVRLASGTDIEDTPSGFRAMTRGAALRIQVFSRYTYSQEMIIQAGLRGIPIASVPVRVNPMLRPSRLIKSTSGYILRQAMTIVRIFVLYRPFRFFVALGAVPVAVGAFLWARWLWLRVFYADSYSPHIPSLVVAAVLLIVGVQIWVFGFLADLLAANRQMLEDIRLQARRQELLSEQAHVQPSTTDSAPAQRQ